MKIDPVKVELTAGNWYIQTPDIQSLLKGKAVTFAPSNSKALQEEQLASIEKLRQPLEQSKSELEAKLEELAEKSKLLEEKETRFLLEQKTSEQKWKLFHISLNLVSAVVVILAVLMLIGHHQPNAIMSEELSNKTFNGIRLETLRAEEADLKAEVMRLETAVKERTDQYQEIIAKVQNVTTLVGHHSESQACKVDARYYRLQVFCTCSIFLF